MSECVADTSRAQPCRLGKVSQRDLPLKVAVYIFQHPFQSGGCKFTAMWAEQTRHGRPRLKKQNRCGLNHGVEIESATAEVEVGFRIERLLRERIGRASKTRQRTNQNI
jgi:hypothetical protein